MHRMKWLAAGLVAAVAALALAASAAAGAGTEYFNGVWHGTDVGDGSAQSLFISGGSTKTVVYYDTSAGICRSLGYSNPAALVTGTGIVGSGGTTMTATNMSLVCVASPGVVLLQGFTINFWVNGDGTISDDTSGGLFWLRGAA